MSRSRSSRDEAIGPGDAVACRGRSRRPCRSDIPLTFGFPEVVPLDCAWNCLGRTRAGGIQWSLQLACRSWRLGESNTGNSRSEWSCPREFPASHPPLHVGRAASARRLGRARPVRLSSKRYNPHERGDPMTHRNEFSRRDFLTTAAGVGLGVTFYEPAYSTQKKPRAKVERLGIGAIGMRYQGSVITQKAVAHGDVVAIADVDRHVARAGAGQLRQHAPDLRGLPRPAEAERRGRGADRRARTTGTRRC